MVANNIVYVLVSPSCLDNCSSFGRGGEFRCDEQELSNGRERVVALSEADDLSLAPIILSVENGGGVKAVFC